MNHSARRINFLATALAAQSYLEIGVQDGHTFQDITVPTRVAVDPQFRFDFAQMQNDKTKFYEITSDDFFSTAHDGSDIDIIFVDGLHQFEQVVRDFSNATIYSGRRSVIILDDTRPNDVYSTLPSGAEALSFRQEAGFEDGQWHGDVYKVVFYVHDFHPNLNYRTIIGAGNPQTLIWRSPKSPRAPRFNNLETISRMTYFDLVRNIDVLRLCSEREALDACVQELT